MSDDRSPDARDRKEVRQALAEASEWRLTGLLLERPRPGWREEVEALAREVPDAGLRDAAARTAEATEGAYLALLGPGGRISAREAAYKGRQDPGREIADVASFYEAFAYRPRAEDPIDHVSVQAGFVGYLCLKEAYALARGEAEAARTAATGKKRFIESHLGSYAGPLARRLESLEAGYLAMAARCLVQRAGDAPEPAGYGPAGHETGEAGEESPCGEGPPDLLTLQ